VVDEVCLHGHVPILFREVIVEPYGGDIPVVQCDSLRIVMQHAGQTRLVIHDVFGAFVQGWIEKHAREEPDRPHVGLDEHDSVVEALAVAGADEEGLSLRGVGEVLGRQESL